MKIFCSDLEKYENKFLGCFETKPQVETRKRPRILRNTERKKCQNCCDNYARSMVATRCLQNSRCKTSSRNIDLEVAIMKHNFQKEEKFSERETIAVSDADEIPF